MLEVFGPPEIESRLRSGRSQRTDWWQVQIGQGEAQLQLPPPLPDRGLPTPFTHVDLNLELAMPELGRFHVAIALEDGVMTQPTAELEPDITIVGSIAEVLAYMTGRMAGYALLSTCTVKGDVCGISALHGLTHATSVVNWWSDRRLLVDSWVTWLERSGA